MHMLSGNRDCGPLKASTTYRWELCVDYTVEYSSTSVKSVLYKRTHMLRFIGIITTIKVGICI